MSALVDYGSSEDEDEDIGVALPSRVTAPALNNGEDPLSAHGAQTEDAILTDAPVLGPGVPTNRFDANEMSENALDTEVQDMSERDRMRYLTQASHPMTSMPPSPPGSPDPAANVRFRRFLQLKAKGTHFNEDLAGKSTFRNPSLLASMMARAGLEESDQYASSLPLVFWDPSGFPEYVYKEQLLKSQQEIREKDEIAKKALAASGKRTIDFTSAGKSAHSSRDSTPSQATKRKKP